MPHQRQIQVGGLPPKVAKSGAGQTKFAVSDLPTIQAKPSAQMKTPTNPTIQANELNEPKANSQTNSNQYGSLTLLPHQSHVVQLVKAGVWGGVGKDGLGRRLIGDEMRVGKTPTAIALDIEMRELVARRGRGNNCTLISCPKSVIGVWVDHLERMDVESTQIITVDLPGKKEIRKTLGSIAAHKREANAQALYVILNWDSVQLLERELKSAGPWFHIIGDEIHRIKGRDTKRTKAFKRIKTKQRTGLSGTPADNRPEDFWSVLNWLYPSDFSSYWDFVDTYCTLFVSKQGYRKITGVKAKALPELRAAISPFYIRRRLAEVAASLPQKQYRTLTVQMGAKQRREYDRFLKDDIVEVQGGDILSTYDIVKLVRLQQMAIGCCVVDADGDIHITDSPASPKLNAIMEYLKEEEESGPFIVLAQHHDTVRLLADRFRTVGMSVSSIIGTTPIADRKIAVDQFQTGDTDVFVGTIGACREGITLSRAFTIIFADRSWNPNHNRQAEARADALDSHLPVTIVVMETQNSIDQDRRLKIDAKGRDTDAITATV